MVFKIHIFEFILRNQNFGFKSPAFKCLNIAALSKRFSTLINSNCNSSV